MAREDLPGTLDSKALEDTTTGEAIFAALWIGGYIVGRHFLASWLDSINEYALYGLDLFYSALSIHFFGQGRFRLRFTATAIAFASLALSLLLGVATYKAAGFTNVLVPFDLTDRYTIVALIVIAPVLEELLFRQGLWFSLETVSARMDRARSWFPWVATSVLFSLSHAEALLTALPEFHPFIWYQTAYTLLIGLWFGRAYQQSQSVGFTMGLHFAFNTGFWLGSIV